MEVILKGEPKEIAALVLAVQGRQMAVQGRKMKMVSIHTPHTESDMEKIADGVGEIFATKLHQTFQEHLAEARARREAR